MSPEDWEIWMERMRNHLKGVKARRAKLRRYDDRLASEEEIFERLIFSETEQRDVAKGSIEHEMRL